MRQQTTKGAESLVEMVLSLFETVQLSILDLR